MKNEPDFFNKFQPSIFLIVSVLLFYQHPFNKCEVNIFLAFALLKNKKFLLKRKLKLAEKICDGTKNFSFRTMRLFFRSFQPENKSK